ncbi:hypothetical protein QBC46DRAFT_262320 [Diplogelasinospora grovesii]|uniref:Glycoside hydrolase family 76 protein n=1 Tax=Diplogelasinospora grovesii TaxID=303347 RepID=A0AAN6N8T9_9PEZI|nr:hypothetical protein QBC46DRAFT_262320 [Diplogelasinospora grovesii]
MVPTRWGGLAARAYFLVSSRLAERADEATYASNSFNGVKALQGWYDGSTGLWDTTGWWNSANCLTVLADWALLDQSDSNTLGVFSIMQNTFLNAQSTAATAVKTISATGMISSTYTFATTASKRAEMAANGFSGFINNYYDDEGWWALAWIRSWDVSNDPGFLDMAEHIFEDMKAGTDSTCGGGIWWSKDRNYKNAIANELYLSVAASLANRVPSNKAYYLSIAESQWTWFRNSGMINSNNLINDGLTIQSNGQCVNNGDNTWSYNQGVILGGLVELYKATGDSSYLTEAATIATAAIALLSSSSTGVIHESGGCEPNCGADGSQFKGIFVRNLHYLQEVAPQDAFRNSIFRNADSIWANDRNGNNQFGISWAGPASAGGGPNASTHSSAMDVLVAAMAAAA